MRLPGERWVRGHPILVDTAIAGLLLLPSFFAFLASANLVFVLDVFLFASLALRRRAPVLSFALIGLGLFVQAILRDTPQWGDVVLLFALYAIAAYGPQWARWAGIGVGFLGAVVATVTWNDVGGSPASFVFTFVSLSAMVLFSWTWGDRMRTRRAYVTGLEERAVRLEREAEQQAQIAAAAERARIAREMHDVVAHSLSVIVVQADGALFAAKKRPEAAVETLGTISETGRESLAEMRRLIGLLRGGEDLSDGLAPTPSGADLPTLIEQVSGSGLQVGLAVDGDLRRLGSGTGLTVYRVIQEALTNTLKHGGPDVSAEVTVTVGTDAVDVRVDDDGRGAAVSDDGDGHGLSGMRERIAVHDGTIAAAPGPGGGFRVDARIPLTTAEDDT